MSNNQNPARFLDHNRPLAERVDDLVGRMTISEKIGQMSSRAPAIERLGVPPYNWWNEALHGVGRAGLATVFPQAIGLASTWNSDLIQEMAGVIAAEGRAKHHEALRQGVREIYTGLTFWSPNVNIFRDPRWGRGQETYGEDPTLTARLGVAFVKGLQGDHPHYLKTVATPKHFAVHSGPEDLRHHFDAVVSQRDLHLTYLPAFKACVIEGRAHSIMGAYNRTNGEACCASPTLLQAILRDQWGFAGYVVSDCGAIYDIHAHHALVNSGAEAAALAVKNGCDLECCSDYNLPCNYGDLQAAFDQGLLREEEIDLAVKRLFSARFRLGMFDPPEVVPYAQIPYSIVDAPEHRQLALEVAQQSLVLLKNEEDLLPLDARTINKIAVIGPHAAETLVLAGNYHGTAAAPVSVLAGIHAAVLPDTDVYYAKGSRLVDPIPGGVSQAITAAQKAQVAIMVLGLSQQLEGEEGQTEGNPPGVFSQGDRTSLDLPAVQQQLLQAVQATGTPLILVLFNGGPLAINWAHEHVPAIIEAWYPGQAGGTAVANTIFGRFNPGGRLPLTFYRSAADLPPFADYNMDGRTYRYFDGDPLYPFGFGLSYTRFTYRHLRINPQTITPGASVSVQVEVENSGERLGDEVVQLYVRDVQASVPVPRLQLQGFHRLRLAPGARQTVRFALTPQQMAVIDDHGQWLVEPGLFQLWVGGQQPDLNRQSQPPNILGGQFVVK
jgi:beta-glucosidase